MNPSHALKPQIQKPALKLRRGAAFGIIILAALVAFEIFNFSTTDYALGDLLGGLKFAGLRWSTILAIAFCGIDFAGIARLFSPERGSSEPNEAWYLFGAWLLAATMNALLTWWGVSMAILSHPVASSTVMEEGLLVKAVPVFVAVMVWLIRILIIGSLSYTGGKLFTADNRPQPQRGTYTQTLPAGSASPYRTNQVPASPAAVQYSRTAARPSARPTGRPAAQPSARPAPAAEPASARPEPTYHSVVMRSASTSPAAHTRSDEPRR